MSNYILWLPGWYPNAFSPLDGDFIQRHAKAVSLLHKITVVFVKKDETGSVTKYVKKETITSGNLTEIIIYYHPPKTGIRLLDRFLSRKKYNKVYSKVIEDIITANNKPQLVHVHTALPAGNIAQWLKKKYSLPYLISEHWTGYLPEAKPNLDNKNFIYKSLFQKLFKNAETVTTVSKVLGEAIKKRFGVNYQVIPNVVDTSIFFPVQNERSGIAQFIHVSLLNYQKNFKDIIDAFSLVKDQGYDFRFVVVGPSNVEVLQQVKEKGLFEKIIFKEEMPQDILAKDIQQADALILYSRYETFGCVVIEANACGIPGILSDLPVFREYIIENKTGFFAKPNDSKSLAETIIKFMQTKRYFSPTEIADHTKNHFGYDVIARQFDALYKSINT